jgi:hypothetical protein
MTSWRKHNNSGAAWKTSRWSYGGRNHEVKVMEAQIR